MGPGVKKKTKYNSYTNGYNPDPDSTTYLIAIYDCNVFSLATIYMVFTAANWIAPPIVNILGPR